MRRLIQGKVRNTNTMETICERCGDRNSCYSTYLYLMRDVRDGKFFSWFGHYWDGLGPDTLEPVANPAEFIEEHGFNLNEKQAARIEELLAVA